jgi:hypothetical protein
LRALLAVALVVLVACDAPAAPVAVAPVVTAQAASRGDTCQHDIPDCEAACALREVHRLDHIDWFDRRCAAVVLGKNPDKAVGYAAPAPADLDASVAPEPASCDPPYALGSDGHKMWKRECFK